MPPKQLIKHLNSLIHKIQHFVQHTPNSQNNKYNITSQINTKFNTFITPNHWLKLYPTTPPPGTVQIGHVYGNSVWTSVSRSCQDWSHPQTGQLKDTCFRCRQATDGSCFYGVRNIVADTIANNWWTCPHLFFIDFGANALLFSHYPLLIYHEHFSRERNGQHSQTLFVIDVFFMIWNLPVW